MKKVMMALMAAAFCAGCSALPYVATGPDVTASVVAACQGEVCALTYSATVEEDEDVEVSSWSWTFHGCGESSTPGGAINCPRSAGSVKWEVLAKYTGGSTPRSGRVDFE